MATNQISSDTALRAALKAIEAGTRPAARISDGSGLYLRPLVRGGSHGWRFDYTIAGKRNTLSLGTYPDTSLAMARKKAAELRALVAAGTDPGEARQADKSARVERQAAEREAERLRAAGLPAPGSLAAITLEWLGHRAEAWSEITRSHTKASMQTHVFPALGGKPIGDVTPADIRACVQAVEAAGAAETAGRVFQRLRAVFRYAVAHDLVEVDPTYPLKPAEIFRPRRTRHRPAMSLAQAPQFLRELANYNGDAATRAGLLLLVLTAVRPGELRGACWSEFDEAAKLWRVPAERMKMKAEHLVPLSSQALAVLADLRPLTGDKVLVFPSPFYPGKPISENTFNSALARMGYKGTATAHGMRTLFSTIANEAGHRGDVIERQLAHEERDEVRAAYNRADYLAERRALMTWWGDKVDALRRSDNVIPFKAA
ncbi:MAG: tyrosine-type recombinase/integrase [Burkholderiales bacterium]|nr:tyrosine-type recombinase/integrase [Burkholderiales bacterium]